MRADLGQHPLDVTCHGLWTDDELLGDLRSPKALGKPLEHLQLPSREVVTQRGETRASAVLTRAGDEPAHAGEQLVRVEGLHNVVIAAEKQAGGPVERLR